MNVLIGMLGLIICLAVAFEFFNYREVAPHDDRAVRFLNYFYLAIFFVYGMVFFAID